ncbi:Hsp70 family protein [Glycomyces harbinensis]|nr:Hsp70 family protein [Glycomyces harbinensis]
MSRFHPRSASISVDFGTSHTVASIRRADGRVHQQLFDGSPQLPSAVFLGEQGAPVTGADALHHGRRQPERFEPNPKRRIDDGTLLLGDQELEVTKVIAAVLSRVANECRRTVGGLGSVTVTVPAAWGPTRRHVIADAALAAGLGRVDLVPEPVAAASYFAEALGSDIPVGSGVVVYDLGGGTFDATVLRRTPTGFDVLAVDGADDLGGLDFDQALLEHLAATVQPGDDRWPRLTAPQTPADQRHRAALLEEVRLAKERLSRIAATDLTVPLLDFDVHLTRDELERVAGPLLRRTVRITQGVIRESGLETRQVAGLFLVGAASRMPLAATLLHRELGIAPAAIEQPELAVSEGGLIAPALASSPPAPVPSPGLPPQTAALATTPFVPHATAPQATGPLPAAPNGPPRRRRSLIVAAATALVMVVGTAVAVKLLDRAETGTIEALETGATVEETPATADPTTTAGSSIPEDWVAVGECMYEETDLGEKWTVDCDDPAAFWSVVKTDSENPVTIVDASVADYTQAEAICGARVGFRTPGELWTDYNYIYDTATGLTDQFFCLQAIRVADEQGRLPVVPGVGDCFDDDEEWTTVDCASEGALYRVTDAEVIDPPAAMTEEEIQGRLGGCPESSSYPWSMEWRDLVSGVICFEDL